jgi:hypothetical protein
MLSSTRTVLGALCLGGAGAALAAPRKSAEKSADGKEDTIPLAKLPSGVLAAARKEAPAAVWKEAVKVEDEGEVSYEVAGAIGSGTRKRLITVQVSDDGEVLHVSEMIDKAKVPAKVMKAFTKELEWTSSTHAFQIREEGKVVHYEVMTTREKPAGKGKKGKKGKKARGVDEPVTVIISPDGATVEVEREND